MTELVKKYKFFRVPGYAPIQFIVYNNIYAVPVKYFLKHIIKCPTPDKYCNIIISNCFFDTQDHGMVFYITDIIHVLKDFIEFGLITREFCRVFYDAYLLHYKTVKDKQLNKS
jgi:hypothetical protein